MNGCDTSPFSAIQLITHVTNGCKIPHQYLDSNSEPMSGIGCKTHVQQAQNFVFRKLTPSQIHIVNEK